MSLIKTILMVFIFLSCAVAAFAGIVVILRTKNDVLRDRCRAASIGCIVCSLSLLLIVLLLEH